MVRPDQDRIGGKPEEHVEADETYVGGRTRGKGRGVHDMVLVAGGVEVRQRKIASSRNKRKTGRYAGRVRLAVVSDRSGRSLGGFIQRNVAPGATTSTEKVEKVVRPPRNPVMRKSLSSGDRPA